VPLEGVEAKLTILNTPSRMAKQKSAQATAGARERELNEKLVVFCIGVDGYLMDWGHFVRRDVKTDAF
jgi:hypothetical protein